MLVGNKLSKLIFYFFLVPIPSDSESNSLPSECVVEDMFLTMNQWLSSKQFWNIQFFPWNKIKSNDRFIKYVQYEVPADVYLEWTQCCRRFFDNSFDRFLIIWQFLLETSSESNIFHAFHNELFHSFENYYPSFRIEMIMQSILCPLVISLSHELKYICSFSFFYHQPIFHNIFLDYICFL